MKIFIITPFPKVINILIENNIANQGIKKNLFEVEIINLRDFAKDNYKKIDDEPYGGGSGMVMMCQPLFDAIDHCIDLSFDKPLIIFPSPRGKKLNHDISSKLSNEKSLIFICGHYKGIDERVIEKYVDLEISIGDFIISNGELSTMIIFDSIARLVPGVLNDLNSAMTDSFVDDLLDAPYFTRPNEIDGLKVPKVLLSGDHKAIEKWRNDKKLEITRDKRPDLLEKK
ncbi:MAG: tRNA (guanosine(37)-N1)-methyltransferase TrmD [Candidatus Marinimicrobia bacterium]|nr:tRNA (guanosine(37)-N1)-methyltransferase TrmD [Candidatus Neomarinimicrobiota bacterium]MDA1363413.1 tRNA (guanosine(37)-N1)-methyltransferase TrmD [Candidatus Neomarinimicrobiota bacterium]